MKLSSTTVLSTLAALTNTVKAQDDVFHTVSFFTDQFLSFEGTIIVPPNLPTGGTPYLWPGFQPPNNQGVLQPVLDGRNEHWYFGNAYVGNPSEPYGGGVDCAPGNSMGFYMRNVDGAGNWAIGVSNNGATADYTYDIGLQMNQGMWLFPIPG
jgi:hypothetical protein